MRVQIVVEIEAERGTPQQIAEALAAEFDGSDIDDGTAAFVVESVESVQQLDD